MNIRRSAWGQSVQRAAFLVMFGCATWIGMRWGTFLADANTVIESKRVVWILGGIIAAAAIAAFLWHRWKTWWSIPGIVRLLGDTANCNEAFTAILASGDRAAQLFRQGLSFEREVPTGVKNDLKWSATIAHRLAVEGLGQVRDQPAVEALQRILRNRLIKDEVLRAKAVWALGEIGGSHSLRQLVPLLGNLTIIHEERYNDDTVSLRYSRGLKRSAAIVEGMTLGSIAADALAKLGQSELVLGFQQTLEGRRSSLSLFLDERRTLLCQALMNAARTEDRIKANQCGSGRR